MLHVEQKMSLEHCLLKKIPHTGMKLWVFICVMVVLIIAMALTLLSLWAMLRKRSRRRTDKISQIPNISREITVDTLGTPHNAFDQEVVEHEQGKQSKQNLYKAMVHVETTKSIDSDDKSQCSSIHVVDRVDSADGSLGRGRFRRRSSSNGFVMASPSAGLPEFSRLGWGHWFTLRDLQFATNFFSKDNALGEGGYGTVYRGKLINETEVAVKQLLNNLGQAEKDFRVEVEAIGHVRHKNLVRLLGYCIEGSHRMLVYEFVNNGNLEQWLHGATHHRGVFGWQSRMKVILDTAKALAYLHEGIEPKVVHRDIKASNILIDDEFNAKVSDFGLAKLLGSEKSHVTTRVMGTFGYVAPEYASTGLLNEKSDVYSFGVLFLEAITGRVIIDYGQPANEVNLIEWLKMMVNAKKAEEVVDTTLDTKPTTRALKRAFLIALRCVDPDSDKRPKMGQIVQMLESDDFPFRKERRNRSRGGSMDIESFRENGGSFDLDIKVERSDSIKQNE